MERDNVIKFLNQALLMEYADVFLYQRHCDYFVNFPGIGDLFKNFSQMESKHADIFAKEILNMGGAPVYNVQLPPPNKDVKAILQFHLANEQNAVKLYREFAREIDDARLKDLMEKIAIEEAIHEAALKQLLNIKWR